MPPVAKVLFSNCQFNGSQYDLTADGYCRNVQINQLTARLIQASNNAPVQTVMPTAKGGSATHWEINMPSLPLAAGTRYVLEIAVSSVPPTSLDFEPVIP